MLIAHPWPGNVRELENACQRATLLSGGKTLTAQHFGLQSLASTPPDLYEPNQQEIEQALLEFHGVISKVARHLGLSRQALYRRMAKYGIKH